MGLRTRIDDVWGAVKGASLLAVERLETGIGFNPLDPELRRDPYPFYAKLRTADPFHRCRNADGWVLSRHADVLAVLRDPAFAADERHQRRFPADRARMMRAGLPDPYADDRGSMLRLDPPDHTRLRGLVAKGFTPIVTWVPSAGNGSTNIDRRSASRTIASRPRIHVMHRPATTLSSAFDAPPTA